MVVFEFSHANFYLSRPHAWAFSLLKYNSHMLGEPPISFVEAGTSTKVLPIIPLWGIFFVLDGERKNLF